MGEHDVFGDCESEPGAAGLSRTRLVDSIKALEDAIEMFEGDAGAEVADKELNLGFEFASAYADALPTLGVFHRILDQIAEDLVERVGIGEDEFVG